MVIDWASNSLNLRHRNTKRSGRVSPQAFGPNRLNRLDCARVTPDDLQHFEYSFEIVIIVWILRGFAGDGFNYLFNMSRCIVFGANWAGRYLNHFLRIAWSSHRFCRIGST